MALHSPATIVPSKSEMLRAWVPAQAWAASADTSTLTRLGSYRFDDPDGEVGMETHLLGTADGQVLQVPLTYRGAPLQDAGASLVTTMTHTTLGDRWVYDALVDAVYLATLVTTIVTGAREADLFEATETGLVLEPSDTHVRGSGASPADEVPDWSKSVVSIEGATTQIRMASSTITVLHLPNAGTNISERPRLTGTWPGQSLPLVLSTFEPT